MTQVKDLSGFYGQAGREKIDPCIVGQCEKIEEAKVRRNPPYLEAEVKACLTKQGGVAHVIVDQLFDFSHALGPKRAQ
eukprot:3671454-Pleurochrysis_carterae.AAC.1